MKVYLFYKKMKDDKNGEILYGVTNNKKYAKKFMKERNMKNFRIEIEEMEKDEYANYCNDNDHRASVLQKFQLATVKDGKHTFHDFYNKTIIMSYWERQIIDDFIPEFGETYEWYDMRLPIPSIFKDKYFISLKSIGYLWLFNLYIIPIIDENLAAFISDKLDLDELAYDVPNTEIDELASFILTCQESF